MPAGGMMLVEVAGMAAAAAHPGGHGGDEGCGGGDGDEQVLTAGRLHRVTSGIG